MTMITRQAAEALFQEQVISTVLQDTPKSSVFMSLARRLPNMTGQQARVPVLDMLPMAYWVNGDTGFKQVSRQGWDNVYLTAAELAVIVPIPEAVLDDASFDIIGEVTPRVAEAIGQRVDAAVMFGVNRPSEWNADLITHARQAGNNVAPGASPDYYDLIMGEEGLLAKIERYGYMSTGAVASMGMRAKLRGIKSSDGAPIFKADMQGATQYALDGAPMYFPVNGSFDSSVAQLIVGDFSQAVYAVRQDITVKILDQGVIQDPSTKEIVYNLAQQDMVALRVVFRMGWALPNPATRMDGERLGCPFAYLEPAAAAATQKLTVTVNDGSTALPGAAVEVNGVRAKSNSSGVAEFQLFPGTYTVKARLEGYSPESSLVSVGSAAVAKTLSLTELE